MFDNIGKKIKAAAKFVCIIGIVVFVITGFVLLSVIGFFGLLIMLIGPLVSWISSWLLYSWGDLVDNIQEIKENMYDLPGQNRPQQQSKLLNSASATSSVQDCKWTCEKCGQVNSPKATRCINCYSNRPY